MKHQTVQFVHDKDSERVDEQAKDGAWTVRVEVLNFDRRSEAHVDDHVKQESSLHADQKRTKMQRATEQHNQTVSAVHSNSEVRGPINEWMRFDDPAHICRVNDKPSEGDPEESVSKVAHTLNGG